MPTKLAIIGLDPIQSDWIQAIRALSVEGRLTVVATAHRTQALAKDLADLFSAPAFDDLRELQLKTTPDLILLDRPDNLALDFLISCITQKIAIFSLGPPVRSVAEALTLADHLDPRTPYLYVWPRFASTPAFAHCAQADEFVRPVKFAAANWLAWNHATAKTTSHQADIVRSLSVLAWDALSTLITLIGMPETVFASFRAAPTRTDTFTDLSGAASLTLRFAEGVTASLTLSDRLGPWKRELTLLGQDSILRLSETTESAPSAAASTGAVPSGAGALTGSSVQWCASSPTGSSYLFTKTTGELIDQGTLPPTTGITRATQELRDCLTQLDSPPSPHRGWPHNLGPISATLEAIVLSQKTAHPESPDRFLTLRR